MSSICLGSFKYSWNWLLYVSDQYVICLTFHIQTEQDYLHRYTDIFMVTEYMHVRWECSFVTCWVSSICLSSIKYSWNWLLCVSDQYVIRLTLHMQTEQHYFDRYTDILMVTDYIHVRWECSFVTIWVTSICLSSIKYSWNWLLYILGQYLMCLTSNV